MIKFIFFESPFTLTYGSCFFLKKESSLSCLFKRRGQPLTPFFIIAILSLPCFYLVFEYGFLDLRASFFLFIISSLHPSFNSYLSPFFNVRRQPSLIPRLQCHPSLTFDYLEHKLLVEMGLVLGLEI